MRKIVESVIRPTAHGTTKINVVEEPIADELDIRFTPHGGFRIDNIKPGEGSEVAALQRNASWIMELIQRSIDAD